MRRSEASGKQLEVDRLISCSELCSVEALASCCPSGDIRVTSGLSGAVVPFAPGCYRDD